MLINKIDCEGPFLTWNANHISIEEAQPDFKTVKARINQSEVRLAWTGTSPREQQLNSLIGATLGSS